MQDIMQIDEEEMYGLVAHMNVKWYITGRNIKLFLQQPPPFIPKPLSLPFLKTGNYNKLFVYQWRLSTKLI
jgi:hypothetical protein